MERRHFLKAAAAAATAPMLPAGLLKAAPVASGQYAKAVGIAKSGAFLTDKYLEFRLGLDGATAKAFITRMTQEGILATRGIPGVMVSRAYVQANAPLAVKALTGKAKAATAAQNPGEKLRDLVDKAQDEPEADQPVVLATEEDAPDTDAPKDS